MLLRPAALSCLPENSTQPSCDVSRKAAEHPPSPHNNAMYLVPLSDRRGPKKESKRPRQVRLYCPAAECGERGLFKLSWKMKSNDRRLSWAYGSCWECNQQVTFIAVPREGESVADTTLVDVFAYPPPEGLRSTLEGLSDVESFDDSLERVYRSAIKAYNNRDWGGSAVHTGKVLEGLAKSLLPEEQHNQTLFELLEALPDEVELDKPLVDLAHAIREGRNLAAHFNQETETDQDTARILLDLLDELLEYLLVTPQHIEELEQRIR